MLVRSDIVVTTPEPAYGDGRAALNALQGLRALAALLVVCDHSISTLIVRTGRPDDLRMFGYFLGELGVAIFFVISGFVMMLAHGQDFQTAGAPRLFIAKRIGRIAPLYWLVTLLYAAKLFITDEPPALSHLAASLLFAPYDIGERFDYPVFTIGWTLNYEMAFYLVFAVGLLMRRKVGLAFIAAAFGGLVVLQLLGLSGKGDLAGYFGEPIVLLFVGGVVLGLLRPLALMRLPRPISFSVATGLALAGVSIAVLIGIGEARHKLGPAIAIAVCVLATVAACAFADEGKGRSPLRTLAKTLGDATYSIYLTHIFVLGVLGRIVAQLAPQISFLAFISLTIPASCVIGVIAYRVVERPLVQAFGGLLTRWARGKKAIHTAGSTAA